MAYSYDHDCPFEAFITNLGRYNEGDLVGEWVKFPTTPEELQSVFDRIGIGANDDFGNPYEEWFISDYDCYVDGLYSKLGEYANLDELNYLASKLEEFSDSEYEHFQAAMQISDYTGSLQELINLTENLDKYDVYPDINDHDDLGRYYIEELDAMSVPEHLKNYIDYEAYGRDIALDEAGQFTDYGYVRDTQDRFEEVYDGNIENIPDEYQLFNHTETLNEEARENMDYENFKEQFTEDVKKQLFESGIEANVTAQEVTKLNESYDAITVTPEGSNVGVNVNVNRFYEAMENGNTYDDVVSRAFDVITNGINERPTIDVAALTDYEQMKDKLVMEVVSSDANAEMLENVPHKDMEDMAVVYRFVLDSNDDGRATILATNQMIDAMGVTADQLHADAMENAPQLKPAIITGMNEVMVEMMGREQAEMMGIPIDGEEQMFVATVPDKIHGAGIIAYQDFMDQAAERVGGDFYILPSSIHEILIVPDNGQMDLAQLQDMVREVNATQVLPEEKLTDNVYHYDSQEKVFELGEKFVERQADREAELEGALDEKSDKGSVLDDLKSKKDEVAKQPKKEAVEKAAKSKGEEL
jgi:antirestriction protein